MSIDDYQICYENLLAELGIILDLSPVKRVDQLLAVSTADVTAAMFPVFITPVTHHDGLVR
jgi:hypothetical protein